MQARWCVDAGCLAAILLLHSLANLHWIHSDATLRGYDMGPHMLGVANAYAVFADRGLADGLAWVTQLRNASWPATSYLPQVGLAYLFGLSVEALRSANLLFLALLLGAVYAIGLQIRGRVVGLLAAALVPLFPGVYADSRQVGLDFPCAAMVALGVAALLNTRRFSRVGASAALGGVAGLATLVRPHAHFFLAAPVLLTLGLALWRPAAGSRRKVALCAVAALGSAVVLAAPYWVGNLGRILATFTKHQQGLIPDSVGPSAPFYLKAIAVSASPFVLALCGVAAVCLGLAWWRDRGRDEARGGRDLWVIWAWLAGGALVLSGIGVHRLRFLVALLPALALVCAAGLWSLRHRRLRQVALGAALLGACGGWIIGTFDLVGLPWPTLRPPPVREIQRTELSLRAGVPLQDPYIQVIQRLVAQLRQRHGRGQGGGVLIRLVDNPQVDPMVVTWAAGSMVMVALPGARFTERRFPEYSLDPAKEDDAFNVSSVNFPPLGWPVRHCYSLRLRRARAPGPPGDASCRRVFDEDVSHPADADQWIRLSLYHYPRCAVSLCRADGGDPKDPRK